MSEDIVLCSSTNHDKNLTKVARLNETKIYLLVGIKCHASQESETMKNFIKGDPLDLAIALKQAIAEAGQEYFGELSGCCFNAGCYDLIHCEYSPAVDEYLCFLHIKNAYLHSFVTVVSFLTNGVGIKTVASSLKAPAQTLTVDVLSYSANLLNLYEFVNKIDV